MASSSITAVVTEGPYMEAVVCRIRRRIEIHRRCFVVGRGVIVDTEFIVELFFLCLFHFSYRIDLELDEDVRGCGIGVGVVYVTFALGSIYRLLHL